MADPYLVDGVPYINGKRIGPGSYDLGIGKRLTEVWNNFTGKTSKENALELARYNNDLALQNWYRQQEYNTPLAQRQRLENAGYNSALLLGNPGSNVAGSAPDTIGANFEAPQITKGLSGLFQTAMMAIGVRNALLQGDQAQANILKTVADTGYRGLLAKWMPDLWAGQIGNLGIQGALLGAKGTYQEMVNDVYRKTYHSDSYAQAFRDWWTKRNSLIDQQIKSGAAGVKNINSLIGFRNWQMQDNLGTFKGFGFNVRLNAVLNKLGEAFEKLISWF